MAEYPGLDWPMTETRMSGHLFLVRADLNHLACDAWLLPTDRSGHVTRLWRGVAEIRGFLRGGEWIRDLPSGWQEGTVRTAALGPRRPRQAWATRVGGRSQTPIDWYAFGVEAFLEAASSSLTNVTPEHRSRHLLALPLVGVGRGGASARKGGVTEVLVRVLLRFVRSNPVDVALVLNEPAAFAAAQAVRWRLEREEPVGWASLPTQLVELATVLGKHGSFGRLVVFFGAGVGKGAGLPAWGELLRSLGELAGLSSDQLEEMAQLDPRDQARVVQSHLKSSELKTEVEKLLVRDHYSLAHALLANLPAHEFVTTNYDNLFESARADSIGDLRVLPYDVSKDSPAWLLKLHGSVGQPDMVITRSDYIDLMRNRAALAGIVQAMLITRHMLFVGYSMRDGDFQEVVDDVRTALKTIVRPVGTALMAEPAGFTRQLWSETLNVVSTADEAQTPSVAEGGRLVEILLDRVIAEGVRHSPAYLLDPAFKSLLSPDELDVADRLKDLDGRLDRDSAMGAAIGRLLTELGFSPGSEDPPGRSLA